MPMCDCIHLPSFTFKFHSPPSKNSLLYNNIHQNPNLKVPTKFSHRNPIPRSNSPLTTNNSPSGDDPLRDSAKSFDILKLKRELAKEEEEEELVPIDGLGNGGDGGLRVRRGRKRRLMRRSSLLAKQVISIRTARSLGFVSQLWVDTSSWMVALVEVRPNLLSGEIENFLLEDVCQVGDVVLVEDECVMENELKMIGLDTLVGHTVLTSGRRSVGKVRGYSFNVNSGVVESLELDSFGISIIPASLISTYCLFVEDVLEVESDTVTVKDGAASRVQRLTKGIWDTQSVDKSSNDIDEYYDFRRQRQNRQNSRARKFPQKMRAVDDDWELPLDY